MKISGCVALVTGGASGIGRGLCEVLLQRNAKVAIVDLNEERGMEVERIFSETYGTGCAKFIRCDVSIEKELKEAFSRIISFWGRLDIVCNNAAVLDEDDWNKTLNTNLGGAIHGTLLGLEHMKSGSVMINTSSTAGLSAWKLAPMYCATKHGIVAFTRSISNVISHNVKMFNSRIGSVGVILTLFFVLLCMTAGTTTSYATPTSGSHAVNPTTCNFCLGSGNVELCEGENLQTQMPCSYDTFPNIGTTHCYTAAGTFKYSNVPEVNYTGFARGCINCT
ncbi:unnamed protein product, partial [Porites evermanni]